MRRGASLLKRVQLAEVALAPKRPMLHKLVVMDGVVASRAPAVGSRWLVVPEIIGLDEWEAIAAPYLDKMTRDALSDIDKSVADDRPEGEAPQVWSIPRVYRTI